MIRLMTIHHAKGLEFPVVILAGLGVQFNFQDLRQDLLLHETYGLCPKIKPPGFDQNLLGMNSGEGKTFIIHFPEDYSVKDMANTDVTYKVTVKEIRRKVLPLRLSRTANGGPIPPQWLLRIRL